jgi:hypothetical protein
MIVDKVWKLTNTVRVGLDARSSHAQRQSTFPDNVCSYCHTLKICKFFVFQKKGFRPINEKRNEKTITERVAQEKGAGPSRMILGGKSLSDTSTSVRGQCVGER